MALTYDEQFVVHNLADLWDIQDGVLVPDPDQYIVHDEVRLAALLPWDENIERARYVYTVAERYSRLRRASNGQVLLDQRLD